MYINTDHIIEMKFQIICRNKLFGGIQSKYHTSLKKPIYTQYKIYEQKRR